MILRNGKSMIIFLLNFNLKVFNKKHREMSPNHTSESTINNINSKIIEISLNFLQAAIAQSISTIFLSLILKVQAKAQENLSQIFHPKSAFKNIFQYYPVILSAKDYLNKQAEKNKEFYISFVSAFIVGSVRSFLLFNVGRPKVALVTMYMEQEKIRKYSIQNKKGFMYYWAKIVRNRNNGIVLSCLGSGICLSLSLGSFDALQNILTQDIKKAILPNIFIGTLFDYLSRCFFVPIRKVLTEKNRSKIINNQDRPYIYEIQSYQNIVRKIWKENNLLKIKGQIPSLIWSVRTGIILSIYQYLKIQPIFTKIQASH